MTIREKVVSDLNRLDDVQVRQVADYLKFLKSRKNQTPKNPNRPTDTIFNIGNNPVKTGVADASENLDKYLY